MIPFTTPKHVFSLPFDTSLIQVAEIIYKQNDAIVLEKELGDCETAGNILTLKLSQEDSGKFLNNVKAYVQVRTLMTDGEVWASKAKRVNVDEIFKREVIE